MALIAIALVLSAVFLPMVFFGGSTGRHLPPVLGDDRLGDGAVGVHRPDAQPRARRDSMLRRKHGTVEETWLGRSAAQRSPTRSNAGASSSTTASSVSIHWYVDHVADVVDRKWLFLGIYAGVLACRSSCCSSGFRPASFRPRTRARSLVQYPPAAQARRWADQAGPARDRGLFPQRARKEERRQLFHSRRRRPGRERPEHRPGVRQPRRL